MSKILVTGANGFVGRHLVRELVEHGAQVVSVGGPGKRSDGASLSLDLTRADEAKKIDFSDITGAIHLAGLAAVGPSFDDPMRYITTNMGIEVNLIQAALDQRVSPRFLIVGSGSLYDPASKLPLDESSPLLPSSPYSVSKLGQEEIARYYNTRGLECIIARPFNHIGPGQEPGFIVPDIAQQIIAVERGLSNEIQVGNLDARRDYTDVRDIVRAYRYLLEKGETGETYNICSGKALSGHEILKELCRAAGIKPSIKEDSSRLRPSDNPVIYGSHQKLTLATGWQPKIPIKVTLSDTLTDWRNR